jgi:uncharacterized membrane protein
MNQQTPSGPRPATEDPILFAPPPAPHRASFGAGLRTWFLTGLIIAGPVTVTAWIVWWFVSTVDGWIKPLVPSYFYAYIPPEIPGIGVVIAFLGLTLLGFLAANLLGRSLIKLGETILDRMPIVRGIYKSVKQIFETVFSQSGTGFRRVGLVEFPAKGMWSIVFISTPPTQTVSSHLPPGAYTSVFLPCTPNPTTGFYFYLPADQVIEVSLTPDDAAKLIMSAGLIQPETQKKLSQLAKQEQAARA